MIKIKDDFDLDKLVGFEQRRGGSYLYVDNVSFAPGSKIRIHPDKSIVFEAEVFINNEKYGTISSEVPVMLYNLFKMGVIEEVRDVEN